MRAREYAEWPLLARSWNGGSPLIVEQPQRTAHSGGGRALRRAALYLLGEVAFLLASSLLL